MSDGATAPPEAAPEASPAPESTESTQESSPEDTKPTPVRESLPGRGQQGAKNEGKDGLDEIADRFREDHDIGADEGEGEPEEQAAPEAEGEQTGDGVPTPPAQRSTEDTPEGTYREESTGRLKDADTHRYVSEAEPTDEPASPEEGMEATAGEAAPEEIPEGFESVELPSSHPLRERGLTHVTLPGAEVVGQEQYEALRSGLNNPVRNRDVQQAQERATEAERRAAELEARNEIMRSEEFRRLDPEQNAELKQQIEDHRQTYGDEAAELLEESLEARREKLLEQGTEEARTQAEWRDIAARFTQTVGQYAEQQFPVWAENGELGQYLPRLVAEYSQLVDAGQAAPDPKKFFEWAWWRYYGRDPRVQERAQTQGARQQGGDPETTTSRQELKDELREELREELKDEIREDLKAEEAEKLRDAAERKRRTTPGNLPSADAGVRTPVGEDEGIDKAGKSPDQVKQAHKDRLRERFLG